MLSGKTDFRTPPTLATRALAACVGLTGLGLVTPASADQAATTDASIRHQIFQGWGTNNGDDELDNPLVRAAYRDLGLNVNHVMLDHYSLIAAKTDYNNDGELSDWEDDYRIRVPLIDGTLEENIAKFDFTRSGRQSRNGEFSAWLSENAIEPDRVRITATAWTPPHWMKGPTGHETSFVFQTGDYPTPWVSGSAPEFSHIPEGRGDSIGGRLLTEDPVILAEYGKYFAAHVTAFEQAYGIEINGLSIQNESTFENPFNSMTLNKNEFGEEDYSQYAMALDAVRQEWEANGLTSEIFAPHMALAGPFNPEDRYSRIHELTNFIQAIKDFDDGTLLDFVDYYNFNGYQKNTIEHNQSLAGFRDGLDTVDADWSEYLDAPGTIHDGIGMWQSETGGENAYNWYDAEDQRNGAIDVAVKIYNSLVFADVSGYQYWQFVGDYPGRHNLLAVTEADDPTQSKKYSAFKHFSRHIRPGAERIDVNFDSVSAPSVGGENIYDTRNSLNITAFLHEEDQTLTYALINMTDIAQDVTLTPPTGTGFDFESFAVWRTSETESYLSLDSLTIDKSGNLVFTIPSLSIMTLFSQAGDIGLMGDLNLDGQLTLEDAYDMVLALDDPTAYFNTRHMDARLHGDFTGDGLVTLDDILPFVNAVGLTNAQSLAMFNAPIPEPSSLALTALAGTLLASRRRRSA